MRNINRKTTRCAAETLENRRLLTGAVSNAVQYLNAIMDQYNTQTDVYSDAGAGGNHFVAVGRISSSGDESAVGAMDENWTASPQSGQTAIACSFDSTGSNWGGYVFMNGALAGKAKSPSLNWGTVANAGLDLTGATQLSFWVKGNSGGEKVEFFALGIGRYAETGVANSSYPDSSPKVTTGVVTLNSSWTRYVIDLSGVDLSYVLGGFGWVATSTANSGHDIQFYVDEIQYNKPRLNVPHFLASYSTQNTNLSFDAVMKSTAYVYDQDVALMAFLNSGESSRAMQIADALIYAKKHDPYYADGRLRNAYQAGDLSQPPGWKPNGNAGAAKTAGWYDDEKNTYMTDASQLGTSTGTMAWSMIALIRYYLAKGGAKYLSAAEDWGTWVWKNCRDTRGAGGFTAGYIGSETNLTKVKYKSTENNLALYSAFSLLNKITGKSTWKTYADAALKFVNAMWDKTDGKFWTGTLTDGKTINYDVVPVEVQALGVLALGKKNTKSKSALAYAEKSLKVGGGYDFNQDKDGVWMEGSAMVSAAYSILGKTAKSQSLVAYLEGEQAADGGLIASSIDGLTTGFAATKDQPWNYFSRKCVSATAWLALAQNKYNPLSR